jgi:signal transduction histidine kinase
VRLRARERQFVADAAHELRTPLALLQAELELALDRPRPKQMLEHALRSAAVEADRVAQLAEDLLLLARLDQDGLPLRTERLELGDVFAGVASRFERRARDADRSLEYDGHGLTVRGDRLRLEQALSNLIENALRHGQGAVVVEAERRNGDVELHVRDEGGGIPTPFAPHAFDRFTRAEAGRTGTGAGLGLAIVLEVARAHGGTVGTRPQADVWLSLPAG